MYVSISITHTEAHNALIQTAGSRNMFVSTVPLSTVAAIRNLYAHFSSTQPAGGNYVHVLLLLIAVLSILLKTNIPNLV